VKLKVRFNRFSWLLVFVFVTVLGLGSPARAEEGVVAISAGISPCVEEIMRAFVDAGGQPLTLVKEATGPLARQIDQGAPYDLLIAADPEWPEWLAGRGHSRDARVCALGMLALWSPGPVKGIGARDLAPLDLAIPNPEFTSYGKLAQTYLEELGLWEKGLKEKRILLCGGAPQCVAAVRAGTAKAALIPLTTAIRMGGTVLEIRQAGALQTIVLVTDRVSSPNALAFKTYLFGGKARATWKKWGFGLPGEGGK
jgi:molybdate transport system substrate-binding protein